ncbi:MAG TPA: carbohydrate binding domain-containing protein, partial [Myxococcaceae bacterium]|nr:carbohydrate binding domain-containing protein [Myxococcaceae bacterium]
ANQVVVDDFETNGSVDAMALSSGSGATINRFFAAGHIGEKALGLNYSVSGSGAATASRVFSAHRDWSAGKYFNFWFYGTSSQNPFKVELLDNRAAGSTSDSSERFEARFTDDFSGWKWISLPWSAFTRSADGQPAGAPSDGLTLTETWGYSVSALGGIGNFRIDQVEVEHPLSAAAP